MLSFWSFFLIELEKLAPAALLFHPFFSALLFHTFVKGPQDLSTLSTPLQLWPFSRLNCPSFFFIYLTVFVSVYEVIPEAPVVQSMNNNISLDKSVSMHCTMSTRESNCAIHWIENCSADISTF